MTEAIKRPFKMCVQGFQNLCDNRWSPKEMFWLSVFAVNQNSTPGLA